MKRWKEIIRQIPWLAVSLILLVGILGNFGIRHLLARETPSEAPTEAVALHTLTFLDHEGTVLAECQVPHESFAIPPVIPSEGDSIVFTGWHQNLYNICRSTELRPCYRDLTGEQNAFYIDAAYVRPGDPVERSLWLGGLPSLCEAEVTLTYDPTALIDFTCDLSASPFELLSQEPGTLVLGLDSREVLSSPMVVAELHFTVAPQRTDLAKTRIHISVRNPKTKVDNATIGTDSVAVYGDIYTLS